MLATVVVATVIAAAISAATATAATDAGRGDAATLVSAMATDAVTLLTEERALVSATDAGAADQLRSVDAEGAALLERFDRLDVDLPPAARTALAPMPAAGARSSGLGDTPSAAVYDAAITGLQRIADTPEVVLPRTPDDGGRGDLVAMSMGVALALGLIVRSTTRRHDDEHDDEHDDVDHEELAAMVWSDGLTGIANRRRLDRDLGVAGEHGLEPATVVMVDVDHFTSVRDSFGLVTGDDVLRSVAAVLSEQVREQDVVYRCGGEQFCVLLFGADVDAAGAVADRIVAAARGIELPDGSHVTVSVGLAAGDAAAVHSTLEHADRALADAIVAGRDRVHRSDSFSPV